MLKLNGVWTHCNGAEVALPPEEVKKCKEWEIAECIAHILISNNLSTAQFVHVSQVTSVKQMWDNLKAVHEHCSQQSIMAIRCTLYQACTKDSNNIVTHLTNMRLCQDHVQLQSLVWSRTYIAHLTSVKSTHDPSPIPLLVLVNLCVTVPVLALLSLFPVSYPYFIL